MTCDWCDEEILPGELADADNPLEIVGGNFHRECFLRSLLGSAGHILHRCSCYHGSHEDPPGLTIRQAAQAAVTANEVIQKLLKQWWPE